MYTVEFTLFDSDEVIKLAEYSSLEEAQQIVDKLNVPTRGYQSALGLLGLLLNKHAGSHG